MEGLKTKILVLYYFGFLHLSPERCVARIFYTNKIIAQKFYCKIVYLKNLNNATRFRKMCE